MAEEVDSNEIHEPPWCPRLSSSKVYAVAVLPVVTDAAPVFFNRRHRVALNASAAHDPSQPAADHQHNDNHPPHAEAQESSPGTRDGVGQRGGHASAVQR